MSRPRSVNEYNLLRHQVDPLVEPESPPPAPTTTYISGAELSHITQDWNWPSPLQRMVRSVGCDLPQHVAEKFSDQLSEASKKAPVTASCPSNPPEQRKPFLQSIPTISIDDEVEKGTENDSSMTWARRPTLHSIASSCVSGNSSMTVFSIDKNHFVTSRIQQLVSAFTDRAKALKERIAQPPTPSTDSSERGGRGPAPLPPPLNLRHDPPSEPDGTRRAKPFRIPSTFHPQSSVYISWLFVVSAAFMYNLWSVPLRITFPYQDDSNVYYWLVADYVADAVYLIDTFLVHPRLRFVHEGNWVEDVTHCRRNYIASLGSKIDFLSLFPLDFLYFYFGLQSSLLRFPRMIRILPFWEFFDRVDMMVPSPFVIRIGRTLFYMLYLIHLNACAYFSYSEWIGLGSDTFVFQGEGNAYMRCFYFAMKTATKIGKNPKPANNVDRTFMIFNWLIGVFACAAIIGQIRDIMAAAERSTTEYRERLDRTVQLMNRLNLPPKIQDRIRMWFTYSWSMQKTLDEISSLVSLPHNMQMDIAMNVHIQTLSKVQLFQDCDSAFIRDLVLKLKPVLFLPGDLVCKKGEVGKEMYIVKTGTVQVMGGPANDKVLVTLSEGSVFGEISLLAVGGGNRRMADVKSQGFSNLFVLSKCDLNEALEYHPEAQKILQRKAKKLVKKSSERQMSSEPIITPKPPTPKLVKTVLQAISADSKTRQFLLQGSGTTNRTTSSMPKLAHASFPSDFEVPKGKDEAEDVLIEKDARSYSEEVLLKPNYLAANNSGAPTIRRHVFKVASNRIAPVNLRKCK
ncbi:cyclic nucleotide-gated cation channel beta-3-like isoform X1 [Daphnia carinata]|uniref:cyclic nucleotide-gated cation channel beta-3-like isoform X1 n=1 Tax=Daphnia carinata TaxID=120202 RepID=UPI00257E6839|nr:cyclic nucleotide-gated cation channel beta-3-like isoform X1 [Daphnia carinata]